MKTQTEAKLFVDDLEENNFDSVYIDSFKNNKGIKVFSVKVKPSYTNEYFCISEIEILLYLIKEYEYKFSVDFKNKCITIV